MVNTSLAATGELAQHLQRSTVCDSKMAARGPQNGWLDLEKCPTPKFLGAPVNFFKKSFLIRALLLWEKVPTEKKKTGKKRGKKEEEKRENNDENSGH